LKDITERITSSALEVVFD